MTDSRTTQARDSRRLAESIGLSVDPTDATRRRNRCSSTRWPEDPLTDND